MGDVKYDHPPLLAPGGHSLSLDQVHDLCVLRFSGADQRVREGLFKALLEFVDRVVDQGIRCDLFIDGSFLTEKAQPDDVDVTVSVELCVFDSLTAVQQDFLDSLNNPFVTGVDSIALTTYPRGHPLRGSLLDLGSPGDYYGIEHGKVWLKGYVVLRLWETDVGNRICR